MATKLKNLRIKKVDFVDEGANPDAHIRMIKRKDGQTVEEGGKKEPGNILKKLLGFIGKAAGMDQSEIDSAMDEIQKGSSMSFTERINAVNNGKIADEMWDVCYALQSSLCSILNDEDLDSTGTATAMQESLDEFYAVVKESISKWSNGKAASIVRKSEEISEADLEIMKAAVKRLNESIEKTVKVTNENGPDNNENQKGEEEMKIDKSKLTDAERAFLESIEKRCGTEAGDAELVMTEQVAGADAASSVTKSAVNVPPARPKENIPSESDDIYKGLHPAVKAELAELRKYREELEDKELSEVAKRYAIIGKKEDELVPLLKSLKAAGGTAYTDMIALLDQTVDTVEKSGAFSEIGKSGHGSNENSAEAKVSSIAKKLMEENPALSYPQAIAKAWDDNPELLAEYDEQEGF